jgi:hypothetical protein
MLGVTELISVAKVSLIEERETCFCADPSDLQKLRYLRHCRRSCQSAYLITLA